MLRILSAIGTFSVCFFVYGVGRTMSEAFGFSLRGMGFGLFLSMLALLPILAVCTLFSLRTKKQSVRLIAFVLVLAGLMGCAFGELQILADEVCFAKQATNGNVPNYSRPRQWPHTAGSLVFSSDRGFWSTD